MNTVKIKQRVCFGELKKLKEIWWVLFSIYCIGYIFLYVGYYMIIELLHSSFSVISVSAILIPFLLLLVFTVFLWKNLELSIWNRTKQKRFLISIATVGCIPPLICAVILGLNEYKSHFTAEKWLNHHSSRTYMVEDLLKKYNLKEMTKDEVTTLLGKPTDTGYFQKENNMVYYLGPERGLISIDSEWLVIEFDDRENVKEYMVLTD